MKQHIQNQNPNSKIKQHKIYNYKIRNFKFKIKNNNRSHSLISNSKHPKQTNKQHNKVQSNINISKSKCEICQTSNKQIIKFENQITNSKQM